MNIGEAKRSSRIRASLTVEQYIESSLNWFGAVL